MYLVIVTTTAKLAQYWICLQYKSNTCKHCILGVFVVAHPSHPDVTVTGVVLACGEGDVGQLGLGPDVMEKSRPALVNIDGQKIVSAVAGGMHTICLTNKGEVSKLKSCYNRSCNACLP